MQKMKILPYQQDMIGDGQGTFPVIWWLNNWDAQRNPLRKQKSGVLLLYLKSRNRYTLTNSATFIDNQYWANEWHGRTPMLPSPLSPRFSNGILRPIAHPTPLFVFTVKRGDTSWSKNLFLDWLIHSINGRKRPTSRLPLDTRLPLQHSKMCKQCSFIERTFNKKILIPRWFHYRTSKQTNQKRHIMAHQQQYIHGRYHASTAETLLKNQLTLPQGKWLQPVWARRVQARARCCCWIAKEGAQKSLAANEPCVTWAVSLKKQPNYCVKTTK